jgi:hypothetical protein
MGKFLLGAVAGALAFFVYQKQIAGHGGASAAAAPATETYSAQLPERNELPAAPRFQCDGRTHCSQMTSCDEAGYFLRNCPNVEMDGDGDGVPCEKQWCGNRR